MSPEEKAVKLALLDCTAEQQEFYRNVMQTTLDNLKAEYAKYDDEESQGLFVAGVAVAFSKFAETI